MRRHWSTRKEYEEGDEIIFEDLPENAFYELMADDALGAATVYVTGTSTTGFRSGRKISYSPKTFSGNRHFNHRKALRI